MKKIFKIIAIMILVLSNIYLTGALMWQRFIAEGEDSEGFIKEKYMAAYNAMDFLLLNGGLAIDPAAVAGVEPDNPFSPANLFDSGEERCMVCRISQYDCESCTDYALEKIVQKTRKWGMKLIVLADYHNSREVGLFRSRHSGADHIDYYIMGRADLPIEEVGMPYYFVLDAQMKVNDVFVPVELLPDLTNRYFAKLERKYSQTR